MSAYLVAVDTSAREVVPIVVGPFPDSIAAGRFVEDQDLSASGDHRRRPDWHIVADEWCTHTPDEYRQGRARS